MKLRTAVILALFIPAADCFAAAGTTSGLTLLEPVSAGAAGIAEACVSLTGDLSYLAYNPAAIAALGRTELSVMQRSGIGQDTFQQAIYGKKLKPFVLGVSVLTYDSGKFTLYTPGGGTVTKTGQSDTVVTLTASKKLNKRLYLGVNLKSLTSALFGTKASAFLVDIGGQYRIKNRITAGFSAQNFGGAIQYVSQSENPPSLVRFGINYRTKYFSLRKNARTSYMEDFRRKKGSKADKGRLTFSLDIPYYVNEQSQALLAGVEFNLSNSGFIRGGYRMGLGGASNIENMTLGFGIKQPKYAFSYSMGMVSDLQSPSGLSFSLFF